MPGWTARVDGRVVPILCGNVAQRVMPILQPGAHTIAMNYRPPGLVLGLWVTSGALLAWLAIVGVLVRRHFIATPALAHTSVPIPRSARVRPRSTAPALSHAPK